MRGTVSPAPRWRRLLETENKNEWEFGTKTGEGGAKLLHPISIMCVSHVSEVRRDGASVKEDAPDRVWVPGWSCHLANSARTMELLKAVRVGGFSASRPFF